MAAMTCKYKWEIRFCVSNWSLFLQGSEQAKSKNSVSEALKASC